MFQIKFQFISVINKTLTLCSLSKKKSKVPNYLVFTQAVVDLYQGGVAWYETVVEIMTRKGLLTTTIVTDTVYAGEKMITTSHLLDYWVALILTEKTARRILVFMST